MLSAGAVSEVRAVAQGLVGSADEIANVVADIAPMRARLIVREPRVEWGFDGRLNQEESTALLGLADRLDATAAGARLVQFPAESVTARNVAQAWVNYDDAIERTRTAAMQFDGVDDVGKWSSHHAHTALHTAESSLEAVANALRGRARQAEQFIADFA